MKNPFIKEIAASGLTPQDALAILRDPASQPAPPCFLLESAAPGSKSGQYSLLGVNPFHVYKSNGENPLPVLEERIQNYWGITEKISSTGSLKSLPFLSGVVGFFSYDMLHHLENIPRAKIDDRQIPDAYFMFFDTIIAFEHTSGKVFVCVTRAQNEQAAEQKAVKIERMLSTSLALENSSVDFHHPTLDSGLRRNDVLNQQSTIQKPNTPALRHPSTPALQHLAFDLQCNMSQSEFEAMVTKTKEYIKAGDTYQVNVSQRFSTKFKDDPFRLYRLLTKINPSPFGGFLNFGDLQIVSCSPERLLELRGQKVQTRPIAGTSTSDKHGELHLSAKDQAEHIMLVDLERNDLGRICEYGSVKVNELMTIEPYSHVSHIVSNVQGTLTEDRNWRDVVTACFPGGTITGTPKVRTMEIIAELEPTARGAYTGSMGYIDYRGNMDLNIIIRSFIIKDQEAHYQVGAGIVADSDPRAEHEETLHKGEALVLALQQLQDCRNP